MRSIRQLLLFFSCIFGSAFLMGTAYAAEIHLSQAVLDSQTNQVHVAGTISSGPGKQITLLMTDAAGTPEYINQATSETDGAFNFTFSMMQPVAGVYHVTVGGEGVTQTVYHTLTYSPPAGSSPKFTIQYYADEYMVKPMDNTPHLKAGTYYMFITSDKPLQGAPLITIDAEGTANDIAQSAASEIAGGYMLVRTIMSDPEAEGIIQEQVTITGTAEDGHAAVNEKPVNASEAAAYIDTILPVATLASAAVDAGAPVAGARSNEVGKIYLLPEGVYLTEADLLAVDSSQHSLATVEAPNSDISIAAPWTAGVYRLYALDRAGNVSAASDQAIEVMMTSRLQLDVEWEVGRAANATALVAGKLLYAHVTLSSQQVNERQLTLLVALYDENDIMANVAAKPVVVELDQTIEFRGGFKLPFDITGYKARVFVIEGMHWAAESLRLVVAPVEISNEND